MDYALSLARYWDMVRTTRARSARGVVDTPPHIDPELMLVLG
jgi:hypothetical protein